jgi:hypothetical protein
LSSGAQGPVGTASSAAPASPNTLAGAPSIAPFGDAPCSLPLFDTTFGGFRNEEVQASGVPAARLTFANHAIATAPMLAAFAAQARGTGPFALALPSTSPLRHLVPISSVQQTASGLVFDVFLDAPQGTSLEALRADAQPVVVDIPTPTITRELPRIGPPPHTIELPYGPAVVAHVEHWVHILWVWPGLLPAKLARAPGRLRTWKGASAPSFIGEDVHRHGRAFVEGSYIEPGARLEANCTVRFSYIGSGCIIGDLARVRYCSVGPQTQTLLDASLAHTVALGGGTLSNLSLRDSVLGKNVFLTTGVSMATDALEGTVTVLRDGEEADTGRAVLGGCAGHGCVLGARTFLEPGRALPNRTTVVMRREEGIFRIQSEPPGTPMCAHDGALTNARAFLGGDEPEETGGERRENE